MDRVSAGATITVTVAYSPKAGEVDALTLAVRSDATLLDALRLSGLLQRHPVIDLALQPVGIWGQLRPLDAALRDGDRIEVYRPLQVDPKEARRLRQKKQRDAVTRSR